LHKNAFGGRAPPGPAWGAIALPRSPSRYKGGGEGKERVVNRDGRKRMEGKDVKGKEGWEGEVSDGKGRVREGKERKEEKR